MNKRHTPTLNEEKNLYHLGYHLIAGVDEVGRGPLAGPLVASAVILPPSPKGKWLSSVRDSKELSARKREALVEPIMESAIAVGTGTIPPDAVDLWGITKSTRVAMSIAIGKLHQCPQCLLIDAVKLPHLKILQKSIVHGDRLSQSIACASIIAKVYRDRMMEKLDGLYPGYGFTRHKGYGTKEHISNLKRLGPSPIHRRSFAPLRNMLQ
ncbi:MAG: ribonuclease HII [Dehalococcoidia bacterium]|nr:ribonuclease HII [Dehalococcoidia bacterium]